MVIENEAGTPPAIAPVAASDGGRPVADAPSPEVAALLACGSRGQNDAELKDVLASTIERAKAGPIADRALVDALWSCFTRFRPTHAKSINLVRDIHMAVRAVKDPSYGPKAVQAISAPVGNVNIPFVGMDEIQFWHLTSIQLLGDIRYAPGVPALVKVLLDDKKKDLTYPTRLSLVKMPKEAEAELINALAADPSASYVARVAETLGAIGRPPGRDAILDALAKANDDSNRAALAATLAQFPTTARSRTAFLDAYKKISPNASLGSYGGLNARAMLAGAAPSFFDPTMTEWLLRENAGATGDLASILPATALPAAIKLMTDANAKGVATEVNKIPGAAIEKEMLKAAQAPLATCKKDVACWLKELAKPVPSAPPAAKMGHVKAAWMAGMFGDASTRAVLVDSLAATKDGSVRLALLEAIDHLSPTGHEETARKIEALVESETAMGIRSGTDEMTRVALRLRARAM
jgi:hypothetical protein